MDDGKPHRKPRRRGRPRRGKPRNHLDAQGTQANAEWFREKEWFSFEEAMTTMRVSRRQLMRWIHESKVAAVFPPMTDGEGEWVIHWTSVVQPPK